MRRLALALALLGCLLVAAPAAGFVEPITRTANLDTDSAKETVKVRKAGSFRTRVTISDTCPAGPVTRRIIPLHENLELLRIRLADTRLGRDVFVVLRDGARGALGEARLVAWRRRDGARCRGARSLFRYDSDRPTRTPSGGSGEIAFFRTRLRNAADRYRGLEVVLDERFSRASDPPNFGSIKKVTYWRYSPARDRYVRYRTKVRP